MAEATVQQIKQSDGRIPGAAPTRVSLADTDLLNTTFTPPLEAKHGRVSGTFSQDSEFLSTPAHDKLRDALAARLGVKYCTIRDLQSGFEPETTIALVGTEVTRLWGIPPLWGGPPFHRKFTVLSFPDGHPEEATELFAAKEKAGRQSSKGAVSADGSRIAVTVDRGYPKTEIAIISFDPIANEPIKREKIELLKLGVPQNLAHDVNKMWLSPEGEYLWLQTTSRDTCCIKLDGERTRPISIAGDVATVSPNGFNFMYESYVAPYERMRFSKDGKALQMLGYGDQKPVAEYSVSYEQNSVALARTARREKQ